LRIAEAIPDPLAEVSARIGLARVAAAFGETAEALCHLDVLEVLFQGLGEQHWIEALNALRTILEG
jgi:hypothetical protein